jgi:hypothetical protein
MFFRLQVVSYFYTNTWLQRSKSGPTITVICFTIKKKLVIDFILSNRWIETSLTTTHPISFFYVQEIA